MFIRDAQYRLEKHYSRLEQRLLHKSERQERRRSKHRKDVEETDYYDDRTVERVYDPLRYE